MTTDRYSPSAPIPESLGMVADLYAETREQRLAMEKFIAQGVKARETLLRTHMMQMLQNSEDTGASGLTMRVQLVTKTGYRVSDFDAFRAFVRQHDAFELMTRAIAVPAVREMFESGVPVPGIEQYDYDDLSITKR